MSEFMNSIMTKSLAAIKTLLDAVQPRKGIKLKNETKWTKRNDVEDNIWLGGILAGCF